MSDPIPAPLSALSDPENVGWVKEDQEPLSVEDAYWRMRGMVPPARVELEE